MTSASCYETTQLPAPDGRTLTLLGNVDDHIYRQVRQTGAFYEADLLDAITYLPLRDQDIVVDVGANIGNHTVFFAGVLGRDVLACEPVESNHANLEANVAVNSLASQVRCEAVALGADSGRVHLQQRIPGNSGTYHTAAADGSAPPNSGVVEVRRLDDMLAGDERQIGLLKVDVEGDEVSVLDGAQQRLAVDRPFVAIEAHLGSDYVAIMRYLDPLGYRCLTIAGFSDTYLLAPSWAPVESLVTMLAARASRARHRELANRVRALEASAVSVSCKT